MSHKNYEKIFNLLQRLLDLFVVAVCWVAAFGLRFFYLPGGQGIDYELKSTFIKMALVLIASCAYFFHRYGLYRSQRFKSRYQEILATFEANSIATITFVLFLYFYADAKLSRIVIGVYYLISTFALILARIIVRNILRMLRRKGYNFRQILLIGDGPQTREYVETVKKFKDSGIIFIGWLDPHGDKCPDIPQVQELQQAINKYGPDALVIGYSGKNQNKTDEILKKVYDLLIPIQLLPDLSYSFIGHEIEDFGGIPVLKVNHQKASGLDLFIKRFTDILGSFVGILILFPLLSLIALLVKLTSKGPCFYGQERVGMDGQIFEMWKFRTMTVATTDEDKTVWGSKGNSRITPIGSFLRKTSLDELPQLWNVLIGEMSLIGPRPERTFFVDKFKNEIPHYMLRHKMKAGITGWAQVNGLRGDTSIEKRIEFDIYYIKNWTLLFDVKIFFLTFWKGFINKNAY